MSLPGFTESTFTYDGASRTVYRRGAGPGVVIMHEAPGVTPTVRRFAERVADAGFSAVVPHLFGTPNKPFSIPYATSQLSRACMSREFSTLATRAASPITDWLRALCRAVHAELGGKGVGALGMCLTGNFALTLMVDPVVMAPVICQPSLPFPVTREHRRALHVSDEDLAVVKQRVAEGACVLGLRFTSDLLCPPERFERLREELGAGFEGIEIDSSRNNPHRIKRIAHSVLTEDLVDEEGHPTKQALDRVLAFFHERLDG